ncbi:MAG: radical SAM family heme chaperone HemW [Vicinamibacterales bacterium]
MSPLGLYVHIPFCAAICNYCNFNRGLLDEALKRRYVDALVADIRGAAEPATLADTIFFGGGTPSLLAPEELARVIAALRQGFAVAPDAEITIEANPETVTSESLAGFRAAGANRISFGVQSFRDEELQRLGRLHSVATARAAVRLARSAGFDNLSLDLMMWLPGQRPEDWLESVEALIDVGPEHASLYLLEIYPNAPLKEAMARSGWSVAPDEDAADMYEAGLARLDRAGYEQYEISNVARPRSRQSRHNLKYWREGEWLGFGCGAHSTRGGRRWRTVSGTADYVERVRSGQDVRLDLQTLEPGERLEEALFMGLRLVQGVDLPGIRRRHGVDVWGRFGAELDRFVQAGLLIHEPGMRIALTRQGMLLANDVMTVFIGRGVR